MLVNTSQELEMSVDAIIRRDHERFPFPGEAYLHDGTNGAVVEVRNFSRGGALVDLPLGQAGVAPSLLRELELTLSLPDISRFIVLKAFALRIETDVHFAGKTMTRIALQFAPPRRAEVATLQTFERYATLSREDLYSTLERAGRRTAVAAA